MTADPTGIRFAGANEDHPDAALPLCPSSTGSRRLVASIYCYSGHLGCGPAICIVRNDVDVKAGVNHGLLNTKPCKTWGAE
jgi:hypothetical protein